MQLVWQSRKYYASKFSLAAFSFAEGDKQIQDTVAWKRQLYNDLNHFKVSVNNIIFGDCETVKQVADEIISFIFQ